MSQLLPDNDKRYNVEVQVPSPTNSMILKLFAFNDRGQGQRQGLERAQAHALDIYITIMLTNRADYLEGREFLSRHKDSDLIQKARSIVDNKFSSVDKDGWRFVLETSSFFPDKNVLQKKRPIRGSKKPFDKMVLFDIIFGFLKTIYSIITQKETQETKIEHFQSNVTGKRPTLFMLLPEFSYSLVMFLSALGQHG